MCERSPSGQSVPIIGFQLRIAYRENENAGKTENINREGSILEPIPGATGIRLYRHFLRLSECKELL